MCRLKPNVVCLIKTKYDSNHTIRFCNRFSKTWGWAAIPSLGLYGGIIVLWNRSIGRVTHFIATRMSLQLVISNQEVSWILMVVYNSQIWDDQKLFPRILSGFSSIHLPWLLVGDFNAILSDLDHKEGNSNSYTSKSFFSNNFVNTNNLLDLSFIGLRFTWCNGHSALACHWPALSAILQIITRFRFILFLKIITFLAPVLIILLSFSLLELVLSIKIIFSVW